VIVDEADDAIIFLWEMERGLGGWFRDSQRGS